jgi:hypothetical protein
LGTLIALALKNCFQWWIAVAVNPALSELLQKMNDTVILKADQIVTMTFYPQELQYP